MTASPAAAENADNVHAPNDIAERSLKTRNMFKNLAGRPKSAMSRGAEISAPANPIQSPARISPASPKRWATRAITEETPATPPTKKYKGTCHVQVGGLSTGFP